MTRTHNVAALAAPATEPEVGRTPAGEPMSVEPMRWTLGRYVTFGERGVFGEEDRVELVEGIVYHMPPTAGDDHAYSLHTLQESIVRRTKTPISVSAEHPVKSAALASAPEPDIAVSEHSWQELGRPPRLEELVLVVEVSDTSLVRDRTVKLPLYAKAGIPEYWIFNLVDRQLEVYTEPRPEGAYANLRTYRPGETLEHALAGAIAVADYLRPASSNEVGGAPPGTPDAVNPPEDPASR